MLKLVLEPHFFVWLSNISSCGRHSILLLCLFAERHVDCLQPLAIVRCAAVNKMCKCLSDTANKCLPNLRSAVLTNLLFSLRLQLSGPVLTLGAFLYFQYSSTPFWWHCNLRSLMMFTLIDRSRRWISKTAGVKFTQHCPGCMLLSQLLGFLTLECVWDGEDVSISPYLWDAQHREGTLLWLGVPGSPAATPQPCAQLWESSRCVRLAGPADALEREHEGCRDGLGIRGVSCTSRGPE